MYLTFSDCSITGQLLILPKNERAFMEDMKKFNFPEKRSLKLKTVMGYNKHRIAPVGTTVSDMAVAGFEYLFDKHLLNKEELDAVVVVTASPDHFLPPTGAVIHGRLALSRETVCVDITQGCCGYVMGLIEAFSLLDQPDITKVAVVTGDVLSHKVSERDRNSYPLVGDAASITIVEKCANDKHIYCSVMMDGTRSDALKIPAGGFREPSTAQTAIMEDVGDGNFRSRDNLVMDGSAVFNFVMEDVPPMIEELLKRSGISKDTIDYYLFHQPNRFMLQKLAEAMEVPFEKMPSNVVEKYGNSSGTTIPAVVTLNLSEIITHASYKVCFSGFGVGLTWGAILMDVGPMGFCETIEMSEDGVLF